MTNKLPALTPYMLNKYIKTLLEENKYLKFFKITGEISSCKYHSNGSVYLTIKDKEAAVNCVIFRNNVQKLDFRLVDGMKVIADASVYNYIKGGYYNLNLSNIQEDGLGDLHQEFLKRKKQYEKDGLFSEEHKQPLPKFPSQIGVVTSATGAAIKDIIVTLKNRYPLAKVTIYPALVQGDGAAKSIAQSIEKANARNVDDVLIVGRGGGSYEDLWSFNEDEVVKAIYYSKIPIISSVGHETDFTLADFVADKRAPTPTAASQIAVPDSNELFKRLLKNIDILQSDLKNKVKIANFKLKTIKNNQYWQQPLLNYEYKIDQLDTKFEHLMSMQKAKIATKTEQLVNNQKLLIYSIDQHRKKYEQKVNEKYNLLEQLNPLAILARGYSITTDSEGKVLKNTVDIEIGSKVNIQLSTGKITAVVEDKEN